MRAGLTKLAESKGAAYYIAAVAFIVAVVFSLVIYPAMAGTHHLILDSDQYGELGFGMWQNHSLSFYPDPAPSVARGPAYPMFEAALLYLSNGWYPQSILLGQCFLVALTCMVVFAMSRILWGRKIAVLAAGITAIHPLVVWFSSRIWIETLATFVFTLALYAALMLDRKPTAWRGFVLGLVMGVGALCKSTFLPLIILMPFLMCLYVKKRMSFRPMVFLLLAAALVISPWTFRNWRLTGKFIPVHALTGVNVLYGDYMTTNFAEHGFSLPQLAYPGIVRMEEIGAGLPKGLSRCETELAQDSYAMKECLATYRQHPAFLLYKIAVQSLLFWTLGETPMKSLVISLMQIPLLILFLVSCYVIWRRGQMRTILGVNVIVAFAYFALHLPFHTQNRYSVVLIPMMVAYIAGVLLEPRFRQMKNGDEGS